MGKLTAVVLVGFLFIHIAEILNIVSIATPRWLTSNTTFNGSEGAQEVEYYKGLWTFCALDNCTTVNSTAQEDWFRAAQALDVIGVGFCTLALVLTYAFLLTTACRNSKGMAGCSAFIEVISVGSLLAVVILFAKNAKDGHFEGEFPREVDVQLAWSYYVGIGGMVATAIAALATLRECCLMSTRRPEYENI